jgi:prevent-host-death family protein
MPAFAGVLVVLESLTTDANRARRGRDDTVTATEAAKNFGALVNRVRDAGTAYVVERQGHPIARIVPAATRPCTMAMLARWLDERAAVPLSGEYATAVRDHLRAVNRPRVPASRWRPDRHERPRGRRARAAVARRHCRGAP